LLKVNEIVDQRKRLRDRTIKELDAEDVESHFVNAALTLSSCHQRYPGAGAGLV